MSNFLSGFLTALAGVVGFAGLLGIFVGSFVLARHLFGDWALIALTVFWLPVGTGIACALDGDQ